MDDVMEDLSPEALTQAIGANLYSALTDLPGRERFTVGDVVGYFWHLPFAVYNGVVRPRFTATTADAGIAAFVGEARARGVPMLWWLSPGSAPVDLGQRLEAHGFHQSDKHVGMAVDLTTLRPEPPQWTCGSNVSAIAPPLTC